jgi:hypothetical protein
MYAYTHFCVLTLSQFLIKLSFKHLHPQLAALPHSCIITLLHFGCFMFSLICTYSCTQIRFLKLSELSISAKYKVLQFAIPLCGKTNFATFWEVAVSIIHKYSSVPFWTIEQRTIRIPTSSNPCLCGISPIRLNTNTTSQKLAYSRKQTVGLSDKHFWTFYTFCFVALPQMQFCVYVQKQTPLFSNHVLWFPGNLQFHI